MKPHYICLLLIGLYISSTLARDFESNDRIDAKIASARQSLLENEFRHAASVRPAIVNPDPSYININGASGRVTIKPHGFGPSPSQDAANLEWALKHFSDIKLQSGTFHIDRMIEAVDFVGTIKGSGINNTIIAARGPLVGDVYEFPLLNEDQRTRLYPAGPPHMLWFHSTPFADPNEWESHRTSLEMRDLTLRADEVGPALTFQQQPLRTMWTLLIVTGPNATFTVPSGNIPSASVALKNVAFIAQETSYEMNGVARTHSNAAGGLLVYGGEAWTNAVDALNGWTEYDHSPINCQLSIQNCHFSNFHQFAFAIEAFTTADPTGPYTYPTAPTFPRSTADISDNSFYNCGNGAKMTGTGGFTGLILAMSDSDISVSENYLVNVPAMGFAVLAGVADTMPTTSYNLDISDNVFHMISGDYSVAAIFILDINAFSGNAAISVTDNAFYGENGFAKYHVLSLMGKDLVVRDNTFHGTAAGAIALSPANIFNPADPPLPTVGAVVSSNDFSDMLSFGPKIFIGKGALYCQIIVSDAADYYDDGLSPTNVIIVSP